MLIYFEPPFSYLHFVLIAVSIVPPDNFGLDGKTEKNGGVATLVYESVPKLSAPVKVGSLF